MKIYTYTEILPFVFNPKKLCRPAYDHLHTFIEYAINDHILAYIFMIFFRVEDKRKYFKSYANGNIQAYIFLV